MADPQSYRPKTGDIPTDPGVYRFIDGNGRIIYVGKAKNLRNRLTSYFANPHTLTSKTRNMVFTAVRVEWTVVATELEALQLEYSWIKEFMPRFNIVFRDDKSYPYLAISMNEEFPRVQVTRGKKRRGTRYFGPYSQPRALRETMDSLLRAFPIRSCSSGVFARAQRSGKPCLLGYIGKCSAPCVGNISQEAYYELAQSFVNFMDTNAKQHIHHVEELMADAVSKLEYERAAQLRDEIAALRKVFDGPNIATMLNENTNGDFFAVHADELEAAIQVFYVRQGRIRGHRGWVSERSDDSSTADMLQQLLMQVYSDGQLADNGLPGRIYVEENPTDQDQIEELLGAERGTLVTIKVPQRGEKAALMRILAENAKQALALHKSQRASDISIRSQALEDLQQALGLPQALLRIECFDISHVQGTNVVASMVVMEDGLAKKSEYRKFNITGDAARDDTASMYDVITRRFRNYVAEQAEIAAARGASELEALQAREEARAQEAIQDTTTQTSARKFAYPPNLVVVDGGQPQVNAAARALADLGITDIAVVGLAKRLEEVWLPEDDYPVILPRSSEALYLIQRLRDEAHRFAITFHRKKRSSSMIVSALDGINGLGESKRKALVKHFGSLKKIRAASIAELQQASGIGPRLAETIHDHLHEKNDGDARQIINLTTGEVLEDE